MSQQELAERKRIIDFIKLYIQESPNDFTMDEPVFGDPTHIPGSTSDFYAQGYVVLKDQYSPVKTILAFSEIYKWIRWRMNRLLLARELYRRDHEDFDHSTMFHSKKELTKILKLLRK